MSREQRRRLLLRGHAAAARFVKREDANNYFVNNRDAFVAGWLLGYRAARKDCRFWHVVDGKKVWLKPSDVHVILNLPANRRRITDNETTNEA